ncbi:hypothetical protein CJU89_6810 [Yarrowia sp. B02]|nr:hypothetical protein CJU89_6810 [Yarrowia sp. B02]
MKIKKGSRNEHHRRQSSDDAAKEYYADARAKLRRAEENQRRVRVDRNSGFADFPEYGGEKQRLLKASEDEDTPSESDYDASENLPPFYVSGNSAPTRNFPRGVYDNIVEAYGVPLTHQGASGATQPVDNEEVLHLLIAEAHFNGLPVPVFSLTSNAVESFWRDENMDFYADDPPVSVPGPQEEQRARSRHRTAERAPLPAFWEILQRIISNVVTFANTELRPIGEEIQRLFNSFEPELQQSVQDHVTRLQRSGLEAAAQAAAKARENNFRVCVGDKQFTLDNLFEALNLNVPVVDGAGTSTVPGSSTNTVPGSSTNPASSTNASRPQTCTAPPDLWRPRHAPGAHVHHPVPERQDDMPKPFEEKRHRRHGHGRHAHEHGRGHFHPLGPMLGRHTRPVPPPPPSRPVAGPSSMGPSSTAHFHALNQTASQYGPPAGPPPGHMEERQFAFIPPAGSTLAEELMPTPAANNEGHYGPPPVRDEPEVADVAEITEMPSSRHSHTSETRSDRSGRSGRSGRSERSGRSSRSSRKGRSEGLSEAEKHKIEVSEYYKQYWKQYFASRQGQGVDDPPPPPPPMASVSMPEVQHEENDGQIRLDDSEFESEDDIWVEASREDK